MRANTEEDFWAKVTPTGFCWTWEEVTRKDGYGWFCMGNRSTSAHRWAYELLVGPIPEGLVLDHLCRNRACVNPDHLEPITQTENKRRGFAGILARERHARQTHCRNGHEYTEANTFRRRGQRECRTCMRERQRPKLQELAARVAPDDAA